MGKRGPKKTPTPILKLRGSWRAGEREGEPQPDSGAPDCPERLSDEARQVWDYIVPQLERMGVLSRIDGGTLARYCAMFARWWKANEQIDRLGEFYPIYQTDKSGAFIRDENGQKVLRYLQQYPHVATANKMNVALLRIEQEFGLTPAARAGLKIEAPQEKSNKSRFFERQA